MTSAEAHGLRQLGVVANAKSSDVKDALNWWNVTEDLPSVDEVFKQAESLVELRKRAE